MPLVVDSGAEKNFVVVKFVGAIAHGGETIACVPHGVFIEVVDY